MSDGKSNPGQMGKRASGQRGGLGRGLAALLPAASVAGQPAADAPPVITPLRDPSAGVALLSGPSQTVAEESGVQKSISAITRATTKGSDVTTDLVHSGLVNGQLSAAGTDVGALHVLGSVLDVPLDDIVANRHQPRQVFDEDALAELASSLLEIGFLQPLVARPLPTSNPDGGGVGGPEDHAPRWELVAGERRWRAARLAGLTSVPVLLRHTEDNALLRDALLENLQRVQLNPLEEAAAYEQLLSEFGCTQEVLATRLGRSRPQVSNTLRLLKLPIAVQRRVAAGVISAGHAKALLSLDRDASAMETLAQRVVSEGLSVRSLEEQVALHRSERQQTLVAPAVSRQRRAVELDEDLAGLAASLGDRLDTRVTLTVGKSRGKLSIEFAGVEDLQRIVALLAVPAANRTS